MEAFGEESAFQGRMRARNQSCKVPAPASSSIFMACLALAGRGTDQLLGFSLDVRRESYKTLLWDLLYPSLSAWPCLEIIWAKPQTTVDSPQLRLPIASRCKHNKRAGKFSAFFISSKNLQLSQTLILA